MTKFVPAGFDAPAIIEGLHKAMGFGEPNDTATKVTFHFSPRVVATGTDDQGIPFSPTAPAVTGVTAPKQVTCACEFRDAGGQSVTFGQFDPASVVITLLDAEYQQVKGFSYLTAAGDKYLYDFTEPVNALGSIDVWIVHAKADNER